MNITFSMQYVIMWFQEAINTYQVTAVAEYTFIIPDMNYLLGVVGCLTTQPMPYTLISTGRYRQGFIKFIP